MSEIKRTKTGKPLGDHEVGYGRPPKDMQFQKGQSGNPKGRQRKKPMNLDDIVRAQLDEKVPVRVGDSIQLLSAREALLMKARTEAFKGGPRDVKAYFELVEKYAPDALEPPQPPPSKAGDAQHPGKPLRLVYPDGVERPEQVPGPSEQKAEK